MLITTMPAGNSAANVAPVCRVNSKSRHLVACTENLDKLRVIYGLNLHIQTPINKLNAWYAQLVDGIPCIYEQMLYALGSIFGFVMTYSRYFSSL